MSAPVESQECSDCIGRMLVPLDCSLHGQQAWHQQSRNAKMYEVIRNTRGIVDLKRAFPGKAFQNFTDEFACPFRSGTKIHLPDLGKHLGGTDTRPQKADVGFVQNEIDHAQGKFFQLGARLGTCGQGSEDLFRKPTAFGFHDA